MLFFYKMVYKWFLNNYEQSFSKEFIKIIDLYREYKLIDHNVDKKYFYEKIYKHLSKDILKKNKYYYGRKASSDAIINWVQKPIKIINFHEIDEIDK